MPRARPPGGRGPSLREGPEAVVPRAATAAPTATGGKLGLSRWRGDPVRIPRDARAAHGGQESEPPRPTARHRARLATESAAQLCFLGTTVQAHDQPAPAILASARSATRCAEYSRILPCSAQNLTTMRQSPLMRTRLSDPPYARSRSAAADSPHASAHVGDILLPMLMAASAIRSHRPCPPWPKAPRRRPPLAP